MAGAQSPNGKGETPALSNANSANAKADCAEVAGDVPAVPVQAHVVPEMQTNEAPDASPVVPDACKNLPTLPHGESTCGPGCDHSLYGNFPENWGDAYFRQKMNDDNEWPKGCGHCFRTFVFDLTDGAEDKEILITTTAVASAASARVCKQTRKPDSGCCFALCTPCIGKLLVKGRVSRKKRS